MRECCERHASPASGDAEAVNESALSVSQALALSCLQALARGQALLHPTDTLPGLAFDPRTDGAAAVFETVKGRDPYKTCLGLVPDLASARLFFAPLPPVWERALALLWPGSLSVVWTASAAAPRALVREDGTLGLRVPSLPADAQWLLVLMRALALPLPTTSVNATGNAPLATWTAARAFCAAHHCVFCPDWTPARDAFAGAPSTVVRILPSGGFEVLRDGAVSAKRLSEALA